MKIELLIGALFFVGMALAPVAVADHEEEVECSAPQDDTLIAQEGLYVTADGGVFEETNDEAGLQSESGECGNDGHGGPFLTWDADSPLI